MSCCFDLSEAASASELGGVDMSSCAIEEVVYSDDFLLTLSLASAWKVASSSRIAPPLSDA